MTRHLAAIHNEPRTLFFLRAGFCACKFPFTWGREWSPDACCF